MQRDALEASLTNAMAELDIVDCHEHLGPEKGRVESPVDVFTLFSDYTSRDLLVAGMSEADYKFLLDREIPLQRRWETFRPYWQEIRWDSYARAALLAARKFYDIDDINDNTYELLSQRIQQANTPGIYQRVLGDACNIRVALTQCGSTDLDCPLLVPLMPVFFDTRTWELLSKEPYVADMEVGSLDEYVEAVRRYIVRVKAEGAVGLKMVSNPFGAPNRDDAAKAFDAIRNDPEMYLADPNPLKDYLADQAIAIGTEEGMVIAVHTGYWGDFRQLDPLHMIPMLQRHEKAKFDIYHLGYPWMRETLMLGKGFPNVWLNFCWTHIISQRFAVAGLDEAIDLVPMSKILIFGGDYTTGVEKVYGHLVMAREDIAEVLARRIRRGLISESQALELIRKWFWDNPKDLYSLDL
jgi:predicted TIM-barrel fold metal-dependent hydrolase